MKYLHENKGFYIELVEFNDPVIEETVTGYGIFNKQTEVREAEVRRLDIAKVLADAFNERADYNEVSADQLSLMPAANERPV
jgi:hypothetical protein